MIFGSQAADFSQWWLTFTSHPAPLDPGPVPAGDGFVHDPIRSTKPVAANSRLRGGEPARPAGPRGPRASQ